MKTKTKCNKTWYSVSNSTYPLSLHVIPYPLVLFLPRNLGGDSSSSCCYCCYQAKVKSTFSPWPNTWKSTICILWSAKDILILSVNHV